MLTRLSYKVLVGVLTTALRYAAPAAAQYSSITDLGDLGGGASVATSINARGQVAGVSLRDLTTEHGFIWQKGVMTDLGGSNSFALGINERGQIVGAVYAADLLSSSAVLWQHGVMTELPGLGGNHSAAVGINSRGQVVGQSQTADGELHAAMWDKGVITDLGTLGGNYGVAYSVNAHGEACGFSNLPSGEFRAARWADGGVTNLGTLGGSVSQCFLGATNRGEFVGTSTIAGGAEYHAWVTVDGVMTDLNPQIPPDSDWLLEYAYGLNERGQIVGGGHREGVPPIRAYLLSR